LNLQNEHIQSLHFFHNRFFLHITRLKHLLNSFNNRYYAYKNYPYLNIIFFFLYVHSFLIQNHSLFFLNTIILKKPYDALKIFILYTPFIHTIFISFHTINKQLSNHHIIHFWTRQVLWNNVDFRAIFRRFFHNLNSLLICTYRQVLGLHFLPIFFNYKQFQQIFYMAYFCIYRIQYHNVY